MWQRTGENAYENDVPAKEEAQKKGTWLPQKDEGQERPQCPEAQKDPGQEAPVRVSGGGFRIFL
jgi:hypothetical protein